MSKERSEVLDGPNVTSVGFCPKSADDHIFCIPNGQSAWLSPAEIRHWRKPFSGGISLWEISSFGERAVVVGKPHLGYVRSGASVTNIETSLRASHSA
jgi:hypothetical protein